MMKESLYLINGQRIKGNEIEMMTRRIKRVKKSRNKRLYKKKDHIQQGTIKGMIHSKLWNRNGTEDMYLESVSSKRKVNTPSSGDDSGCPTPSFKV